MKTSYAMFHIDDCILRVVISRARRRLVFVAPGVSTWLAEALVDRWRALGPLAVSVSLDVDEEVFRLGYGDIQAVRMLEDCAAQLGTTLNVQPGIRIGVVILDKDTLIYAPTPARIEQCVSRNLPRTGRPNGVVLGKPYVKLAIDLGIGPQGVKDQTIGLDKAERARIEEVDAKLKAVPPLSVNTNGTLRVFSAHVEFVELRLSGIVHRRKIKLPSELIGLVDESARNLLESDCHLVAKEETGVWGTEIRRLRDLIVRRFMVQVPTYGYVVRMRDKQRLQLAVKTLQRMLSRSRERECESLQAAIDRSVTALHQSLLPGTINSPPGRGNATPESKMTSAVLMEELRNLAGSAHEMLADAEVTLRFKGVTYDTLSDPEFIAAIRLAMPDLPALHDVLEVAPVVRRE